MTSNNTDFKPTGKFFIPSRGTNKGKTGEAILFLDWGGVILQFPDGEKTTFAIYDVQPVKTQDLVSD